jgi:hypothetical protein
LSDVSDFFRFEDDWKLKICWSCLLNFLDNVVNGSDE